MSEEQFTSAAFRERVRAAVERWEGRSSAELVVVVCGQSAVYDGARHAAGALGAFAFLLVLLFHPREFSIAGWPSAELAVYALCYWLAGRAPHLQRWLSRGAQREAQVRARAALSFHEQRVAATRSRKGVLLFVSLLERRAEVLADTGVAVGALGEPYARALEGLQESLARGCDVERFLEALDALGSAVAAKYPPGPRRANELDDALRSET